jgi:hypothetical protein
LSAHGQAEKRTAGDGQRGGMNELAARKRHGMSP